MGFSKRLRLPRWDGILLLILAVGVLLLFFRLDHRPFWQDEAETACLARNVLHYGVPKAFDGTNLISQEQGKEFGADYLWRWSPWLQIYITAGAFRIGGLATSVGRFPFAFLGAACLVLVYLTVRRNFDDLTWARMAAALLAFSVPFLLFSRQCRYYSIGMLLTLVSIYAFQRDSRLKTGPTLLLVISLGLLFHANYLLFFSFAPAAFLAAWLIYPEKIQPKNILQLGLGLAIIIIPAIFLFRIQKATSMIDIIKIMGNLQNYISDLFQFLIPLPVVLYLIWRWRRVRTRHSLPPEEKFVLFLFLIIIGNLIILAPVPQCEHRYLVHLYPLCAIILGWLICLTWRYHKFSGALLALLLLFTNWLYQMPMEWLRIVNRPQDNNAQMLTYPNIPLALYLTELRSDYPDVNRYLIRFFQGRARPGDTILVTYDDLPLQFYTSFRIIGSLQGPLPAAVNPDWVVKHFQTQWSRDHELFPAEKYIINNVISSKDYQVVTAIPEEEIYGNIPGPYDHHFLPITGPSGELTIYQRVANR
jgi:4-amino-4-deoxy-L-arabinose transferase-like glycosyltransferase